ncbi:protein S100-A1-like [Lethenteron reissneri]|uniref:protein S100-A1-like n=1 Tax=Lethenteron reissneri TaxID=7753 RepID=UPI002AB71C59|nr:protein S100-A1-like [Lethenteron reissneri]
MAQPKLDGIIKDIVLVFNAYSSESDDATTLSKEELGELMRSELPGFLNQLEPGMLDQLMQDLDTDEDGQVNFQEFMSLLSIITIQCDEEYMKLKQKKKGGRS